MPTEKRAIIKVNVVARNFDETLRFYRMLGMEIDDPLAQPPGVLHATANTNGVDFALDNEHLARLYNAGWRTDTPKSAVLLTIALDTRDEVDVLYRQLIEAGYPGKQPPYDAFWGARYAVVCDPEGNDVGLESPTDRNMASFPSVPSPDLP